MRLLAYVLKRKLSHKSVNGLSNGGKTDMESRLRRVDLVLFGDMSILIVVCRSVKTRVEAKK